MSQLGEAHKIMMRHLDWTAKELKALAALLPDDPDGDAAVTLRVAALHLQNARTLAEQIDSGVVYSLGDETLP